MATTIERIGFGQVEPNHLSAQGNRQIYAQLPVDTEDCGDIIENGRFLVYDYAEGKIKKPTAGGMEPMLVYSEVKVYDERDSYKDFALIKTDFVGGEIYPRLFKTNVGDIFTTNCIKAKGTGKNDKVGDDSLTVGDTLKLNADGYLEKDGTGSYEDMEWKVVKEYTMPDGQAAVKIQRVK